MGVDDERGRFLAGLVRRYVGVDGGVLEVGCRAGRNLNTLLDAGFTSLTGVEDDPGRVDSLKRSFPRVAEAAEIVVGPLEDAMARFADRDFELVLSVGFFADKGPEYDWLLDEMARVSGGIVITIEDERGGPGGVSAGRFRQAFEEKGFRVLESVDLRGVPGLESVFTARVNRRV